MGFQRPPAFGGSRAEPWPCLPCAPLGTGYGTDAVISGRSDFKFKESYVYLYQTFTGAFSGNTITGTVFSVTPALKAQKTGAPKTAVACTSAAQSYTLTLSGPAAANRLQAAIPVYSIRR